MKYRPSQATVIETLWLRMPTGLAIAWTDQVSYRLLLNLHKITDDMDLAKERPIKQLLKHEV
jgi:hypothetical protein